MVIYLLCLLFIVFVWLVYLLLFSIVPWGWTTQPSCEWEWPKVQIKNWRRKSFRHDVCRSQKQQNPVRHLICIVSLLLHGLWINSTDFCNSYFSRNGDTLVICSEGNAGFYEIGIMATPIEGGYSVLGWNHPGFGGSSVSSWNI